MKQTGPIIAGEILGRWLKFSFQSGYLCPVDLFDRSIDHLTGLSVAEGRVRLRGILLDWMAWRQEELAGPLFSVSTELMMETKEWMERQRWNQWEKKSAYWKDQ
jgi:hypothetical protein